MTIVLDVSFNENQPHDSQSNSVSEISRKKAKEKQNESSSKAIKVAKVKNKVSCTSIAVYFCIKNVHKSDEAMRNLSM